MTISARLRGILIGGAAVLVIGGIVLAGARAQNPAPPAPLAAPAPPVPPVPPAGGDAVTETKEAPTTSPTVRIVFKVVPPNIATVTWGNKRLGIIKPKAPVIIERPRDSGPMDVVFKSNGYVTVHTRVYTFTNSTLAVKLTPLDKKNTIYGFREEAPPEADAGAPPMPGGMGPDAGVGVGAP
jgi:hypothetical protein